jgi:hypothetical protein
MHWKLKLEKTVELPSAPTLGRKLLSLLSAHKAPSKLPNEVAQSENSLSGPATSHDDVHDIFPIDDLGDEDLKSYDDDFDVTPAVRKGKGKSRVRIEGEHDNEGAAEGPSVARLPASYASRSAKTEPSFSIIHSPPKRSAPAASPQRTIRRGAHRLFSPRVKSV